MRSNLEKSFWYSNCIIPHSFLILPMGFCSRLGVAVGVVFVSFPSVAMLNTTRGYRINSSAELDERNIKF